MAQVKTPHIWNYPMPKYDSLQLNILLGDNDLFDTDFTPITCDNAHAELYDCLKNVEKNRPNGHFKIVTTAQKYLESIEILLELIDIKCPEGIAYSYLTNLDTEEDKCSWKSTHAITPLERNRDRLMINGKMKINPEMTKAIVDSIPLEDSFMFSLEYEACFAICVMVLGYINAAEMMLIQDLKKKLGYDVAQNLYLAAAIVAQIGIGWSTLFQSKEFSLQTETLPRTYEGLYAYAIAKAQIILVEKFISNTKITNHQRCTQYLFIVNNMNRAHNLINATCNICCSTGISMFALYYKYLYYAKAYLEYALGLREGIKNGQKIKSEETNYSEVYNITWVVDFYLKHAKDQMMRCKLSGLEEDIKNIAARAEELRTRTMYMKNVSKNGHDLPTVFAKMEQIELNPLMYRDVLPKEENIVEAQMEHMKKIMF